MSPLALEMAVKSMSDWCLDHPNSQLILLLINVVLEATPESRVNFAFQLTEQALTAYFLSGMIWDHHHHHLLHLHHHSSIETSHKQHL